MFPLVRSDERRRAGRIRCSATVESLGQVMDLSNTGMRVRSHGWRPMRVGQTFHATLRHDPHDVTLPCRAVWTRRIGFMRHEIGVEFVEPTEQARKVLTRIIRDHLSEQALVRTGT